MLKGNFSDVPHPHNISVNFLISCLLSFHIPLLLLTLLYFTHVTSPGSPSLTDSSPSLSLSLFLHRLPRLHPYIHITFLQSLFLFFYLSPPSLYFFFYFSPSHSLSHPTHLTLHYFRTQPYPAFIPSSYSFLHALKSFQPLRIFTLFLSALFHFLPFRFLLPFF